MFSVPILAQGISFLSAAGLSPAKSRRHLRLQAFVLFDKKCVRYEGRAKRLNGISVAKLQRQLDILVDRLGLLVQIGSQLLVHGAVLVGSLTRTKQEHQVKMGVAGGSRCGRSVWGASLG